MALILNVGPMRWAVIRKDRGFVLMQPLLTIKKKGMVGVSLTQRKALILTVEVILGALI